MARARRLRMGAATVVLLAGLGVAAAAAAEPAAGPALVALGDSIASGEGAGRYEAAGPRLCHRSATAPIHSAARELGVGAVNLACSGARLHHLLPAAWGGRRQHGQRPQADRLAALARSGIRMVVIAAGANDAGFGRLVAGCALAWARGSLLDRRPCRERAGERLRAALPGVRRGMERVLAGVRGVLADRARAGEAPRLVVAGYSSPYPAGARIRYPEEGWSRLRAGCPVWDADADWALREATPGINAALRAAARASGAEYLDLERALDGRRVCERGAEPPGDADPSAVEWVRGLRFGPASLRESLHPNGLGQRALGACIAAHFSRPAGDGACGPRPDLAREGGTGPVPLGR